MTRQRVIFLLVVGLVTTGATSLAEAQDEAGMFGNTPSRNMVSDDTGVPETWDPKTGANILWTQPVGSQAYGGPTVGNGKVYVGTNNEGVRNPDYDGDKGVLRVRWIMSGNVRASTAQTRLEGVRGEERACCYYATTPSPLRSPPRCVALRALHYDYYATTHYHY